MSITSAHKRVGGGGGQVVRLQNGGTARLKSRDEITGLWLLRPCRQTCLSSTKIRISMRVEVHFSLFIIKEHTPNQAVYYYKG